MTISLGLDIGSNSVGSAWVDLDKKTIHLGVSIFPAGVDEQENKRGSPKNQDRREKRSQRRTIHRRAERKRRLTSFLIERGLLPSDPDELQKLFNCDPWQLRRKALHEALSPHEFGRVVIHLAQRRGAVGVETDPDDPEEGKVKEGMDRLSALMTEAETETVGQFLAGLIDERRQSNGDVTWNDPIRNRQYRMPAEQQLFAGRELVRKEFHLIAERQRAFIDSTLAPLLTDELIKELDDQSETNTWRHRGLLFGQRRTYWDTGTLGRCDLEPTERCIPVADRHAGDFRVIETVNNIRITERDEDERALNREERDKVIAALRSQKTASVATVRKALGIHKKAVKDFYTLNIERDKDREINTDWFYRVIVHDVFNEERWNSMDEKTRESVNRALLKFDPDNRQHEKKLREGAETWWGIDADAVDRLVTAGKERPKLEKRLKLSRTAIRSLLPYMNEFDEENQRWPTQIEARRRFAEDRTNSATYDQRIRYDLGAQAVSKRDRQYVCKHDEPIPPAPMLSNPVVRKAIHEVRRHILHWWHKFDRMPDSIVIEYVRSATQPGKVRQATLDRNRKREVKRKAIIEQFALHVLSSNQQRSAVERILLLRQQKGLCAYTGKTISEQAASDGRDVESDHIIPKSRSQDNGYNNKVLVTRESNRGKGNKTVKEWMTPEQFSAMEQRLAYLEKGESPSDYFTKKDCGRKWENLHRDAPTTANFLASQLTDTAYAAKQVGQWLRAVLYDGERDGRRHVFTTKGSYTSILRNDWGLSESDLDRQWHDIYEPGEAEGNNRSRRARKEKNKDRADHVHHAIDAVCIALTSHDRIKDLARFSEEQEIARADLGHWPRRRALPPPWPALPSNPTEDHLRAATAEFRQQILNAADQLTVSHRPVKRRLVGRFHEETHYGPVLDPLPSHRTEKSDTLFTNRINADGLTPNHLRVPDGWDDLSNRLDDNQVSKGEKVTIRRKLAAMPDHSPGKSGIVRDRALRDRIRKNLKENAVEPDDFTKNQIKQLVKGGKLTMKSGVPIKGVVLLRTNADPVIIPRKTWDPDVGKMVLDRNPRTARVYIGGNNHHVEIRKRSGEKKGQTVTEWVGKVVTTFEAVKRVRPPKDADGRRREPLPAVDRSDSENARFVMSLSEGEMIYARRWNPKDKQAVGSPDHFVVCKLDKAGNSCRIHFAPHWDARKASEQDRWAVTPGDLKNCGPESGKPPYKVRVSPLGEVRRLERD